MYDKFHIWEIVKDGLLSIEKKKPWVFFYFPAIVSCLLVVVFKAKITKDYVGFIVSALAIFTGFFFTLIVYVADKATNKKAEIGKLKDETALRFLGKYLKFSEKLISQISYSIVVSLALIMAYIVAVYDFKNIGLPANFSSGFSYFFNFIAFSITFHFIAFLLLIVSNMYVVFINEIIDQPGQTTKARQSVDVE
jgi:hypothetical protein